MAVYSYVLVEAFEGHVSSEVCQVGAAEPLARPPGIVYSFGNQVQTVVDGSKQRGDLWHSAAGQYTQAKVQVLLTKCMTEKAIGL